MKFLSIPLPQNTYRHIISFCQHFMGENEYKNLLRDSKNHIHPDALDTEFAETYVKKAKEIIEDDTCEKRKEITQEIHTFKDEVVTILGKKMRAKKKDQDVNAILEKTLTTLNENNVFSSTCSEEYQVPFLKDGNILTHCPGDSARNQLIKYFIAKIEQCWQGPGPSGKFYKVQVEHSDGLCKNHSDIYY